MTPVVETVPADLLTPLGVYLKLSKPGMSSFLLESVEGGESLARYSFIGTSPEMIVSATGQTTKIGDRTVPMPMIDLLRRSVVSGR